LGQELRFVVSKSMLWKKPNNYPIFIRYNFKFWWENKG
jgi:hypothetical protein